MPAFHPLQDSFPRSDYPPQFLQPKYDGPSGPADYRMGHHALRATVASEHDLLHPDPYNYGKHASVTPSSFHFHGEYTQDPFGYSQHVGAPMIQPLQIDNRYANNGLGYGPRRDYTSMPAHEEPKVPDEKVVGGVSAQLDYEMGQMTDFVVDMASGIVKPPVCDQSMFRKWVLQVLNATRLPSATIILSLSYLALRVRGMSSTGYFVATERGLYQMLTVSLILGSKFLDDNTFQNKSWAEVSNIPVRELNKDEISWLDAFGHRLHYDLDMADGFAAWQRKWDSFKMRTVLPSTTLHPLDTAVRRARSLRQSDSPMRRSQYALVSNSGFALDAPQSQASTTPTYSPYESWYSQQSIHGSSPSTAAQTGPTTPDYYATAWHRGGYSARDATYEFATLPHFTPNFQPYEAQAYDYTLPSMWNCHGNTCQCSNCRQTHLAPRYGPITAA